MLRAIALLFLLACGAAYAQTAMLPAVNTTLTGCIEGRALRWTNGSPACTPGGTPILSSCGTNPTLSTNSNDFAGVINIGTGVVLACTLNFSKTYNTPMACQVSGNSGTITVGMTNATTNSAVFGLSLSLGGGKINYICFPS